MSKEAFCLLFSFMFSHFADLRVGIWLLKAHMHFFFLLVLIASLPYWLTIVYPDSLFNVHQVNYTCRKLSTPLDSWFAVWRVESGYLKTKTHAYPMFKENPLLICYSRAMWPHSSITNSRRDFPVLGPVKLWMVQWSTQKAWLKAVTPALIPYCHNYWGPSLFLCH